MPKTDVTDYTRELANGTQVKVHGHKRTYTGSAQDSASKLSPVESHRRDRLKAQAKIRREAAMDRAGDAARKGWAGTKRRGRQTLKLTKAGGRRLKKAARYASRRKRAAAACCLVGGVAEIGAGLAWSAGGVIVTTVCILGAALTGGLLLGGKQDKGGSR